MATFDDAVVVISDPSHFRRKKPVFFMNILCNVVFSSFLACLSFGRSVSLQRVGSFPIHWYFLKGNFCTTECVSMCASVSNNVCVYVCAHIR
jgi:hypothetical protein